MRLVVVCKCFWYTIVLRQYAFLSVRRTRKSFLYNQVLNQNSEYEFMRVIKLKLHFSLPYNMNEFMYLTVLSV